MFSYSFAKIYASLYDLVLTSSNLHTLQRSFNSFSGLATCQYSLT
ncbi:hypothetical protein XCR1_1430016 [Xenorhabdus cabanillasii JM26]|uniref:Uncharacterized protein n=1 Tax=Xenorhabdus cabanillasii JM26 TaxID=1427517 RepID=W1IP81_9GAMM|nr:hypothetical protein XCR1_1430016 [Xenorhabdus cabanillasii JM26]